MNFLGFEFDSTITIAIVLSSVALIISIFRDFIHPKIFRPVIEVEYSNSPGPIQASPYMSQQIKGKIDSNWLRLIVRNKGRSTARNVYVKLNKIENGKNEVILPLDPVPLLWTVWDSMKPLRIGIDLAKGEFHYVNIVSQIEKQTFFKPSTLNLPNSLILNAKKKLGPGRYHLHITVYGDNIKPLKKVISINVYSNYKKLKFICDGDE